MYRNVPEHPLIAEILRNGELFDAGSAGKAYSKKTDDFSELQVCGFMYISDDEFAEICGRRLEKLKGQ